MRIKTGLNILNTYLSFWTNKARVKPKRAGWYITDLCNARCVKCNIWKTKPEDSKDLSLEDNKKIIDNFHNFGIKTIAILGGEPFRYNHIFEIINYARKKGIKVELNTNGLLLNEEKIDILIKNGVDRLGFSVDGVKPESHDKMIGIKGAHERLLKNIKYYTSKGGTGHLSTVISPYNTDELIGLYYLAQDLGLDGIIYQPFQYVPAFIGEDKREELDYKDYVNKIDTILDQLVKLKKKNNFTIYNSVTYLKTIKKFIRNKNMGNFCFAPYCHVSVDNGGNLIPCTPFRKKLGNFVDTPLEELWNSKEFIRTRKCLKKNKICNTCFLTGDAEEVIAFYPSEIIRRMKLKNIFKLR